MDPVRWNKLLYTIKDYVEMVAEPYFAIRRLSIAIRPLYVLEDWSAHLPSLGLV